MSKQNATPVSQMINGIPVYYSDPTQRNKDVIFVPKDCTAFVWVKEKTFGLLDEFSHKEIGVALGYEIQAYKNSWVIGSYDCRMTRYTSRTPRWLAARRLQFQIKRAAALLTR